MQLLFVRGNRWAVRMEMTATLTLWDEKPSCFLCFCISRTFYFSHICTDTHNGLKRKKIKKLGAMPESQRRGLRGKTAAIASCTRLRPHAPTPREEPWPHGCSCVCLSAMATLQSAGTFTCV